MKDNNTSKITIRPFHYSDQKVCLAIIERVVIDGFIETGIDIKKEKEHLNGELENQKKRLESFPQRYAVALKNSTIVGMIATLPPGESIAIVAKDKGIDLSQINEIVAVYVHPEYQHQGIGSALLTYIGEALRSQHVSYGAMSTGYKKGRAFWTKKFGPPAMILPAYYSGHPCFVWIIDTRAIL